ncbi:hypothetical protein IAT40_002592 [Kwoniella sp. CBS 6097]
MFNQAGESPCLIWSKMQSLCLPQTSYINVPPLGDSSFSYNAPSSQASRCQCNSVSYSLMSACALCQWPSTELPSEEAWSSSCEPYTTGLDFDQSVLAIPLFAYHYWSGKTFEQDVAKTVSASPSPTSYPTTLSRSFSPAPTPTSTSVKSATSTSDGSSTSSSSSSSSSSSGSRSGSGSSGSSDGGEDDDANSGGTAKWAPIIGGIAGGVALLVLLFLIWRWYITRHRPSSSSKPKKRIPYPYPSIEGGDGPGGPGGKSFLDMVAGSNSRLVERDHARQTDLKRRTAELMSDPSAFAEPRTAPPIPFGFGSGMTIGLTPLSSQRAEFSPTAVATTTKGKGKNKNKNKNKKGKHAENDQGYKTTTQRLAERPISLTSTDIALATASQNKDYNALAPLPPSRAYLAPGKRSSTYNADSIDFSSAPLSRRSSALSGMSGMSGRSESSMSAGILSPQDFKGDENALRAKTKTRLSAIPPAAARKYFSSRLSEVNNNNNNSGHGPGQIPSLDFSAAPASSDTRDGAGISRNISTRTTTARDLNGRAGNRDSENTLPSLYEPQTGALTYRASGNTMFSADMSDYNAHYPGTQTLYGRIAGAGGGRDSFGGFDEPGAGRSETKK